MLLRILRPGEYSAMPHSKVVLRLEWITGAVVVAQLAECLRPTVEAHGLNPVIGEFLKNIFFLITVLKRRNLRKRGHDLKKSELFCYYFYCVLGLKTKPVQYNFKGINYDQSLFTYKIDHRSTGIYWDLMVGTTTFTIPTVTGSWSKF